MFIQIAQINIFNSKNCYNGAKPEYKIKNCSKMNYLINSGLNHFNDRKRIYFNRVKQRETEMRL